MASARDTPTVATPAAVSHTPLAVAWHRQTEHEVEVAYAQGYEQALADIATGAAELSQAWRPIGRISLERRIARDIAAMEALAATQPGSTWRGRYPGGPVDWETGRLARPLRAVGEAA